MKIALVDLFGEGDVCEREGEEYWKRPLEIIHEEGIDTVDFASGVKTIKQKIDAFHQALQSDVDLVWFVRGGYLGVDVLPLINWASVKSSMKSFYGLSDFAHFAWMATLNGSKCFYGQGLTHLESTFPKSEDRAFFFSFLKTGKLRSLLAESLSSDVSKDFLNESMIGGHLTVTLLMLLRYPVDLRDRYLFLEYHPGGLNEQLRDIGYLLEHLVQTLEQTQNIPKGIVFGQSMLPQTNETSIFWKEINQFCAKKVLRLNIPIYEVDHFKNVIPFQMLNH